MFDFPVVRAGEEIPSLPAFVIGSNGIFLRKETSLGVSQTRVSNIAHLPQVSPELDYKLPPIPKKLSAQIAGFLLLVDEKYGGEGALLLCLDKKRKWRVICPRQDASGMDVKYFVDDDTIPPGWLLAGTVHSHPFNRSSAPTASWTDESDERKIDGVHLVAGALDQDPPQYGAAVVINGTRFKYYDWQQLIVPAKADPTLVPEEWFDKIEKKKKGIVGKVTSTVSSWGGSTYKSNPDWMPRDGETPEQAIARARKYSFEYIAEDAAKLGYKLVWHLEELPEGATEIEEKTSYLSTQHDTVAVGGPQSGAVSTVTADGKDWKVPQGTTCPDHPSTPLEFDGWCPACKKFPLNTKKKQNGGDTLFPIAKAESPWRDATPIYCKQKHPGDPCPEDKKGNINCGCHCEPCRTHTVGAYDAAEVSGLPRSDEEPPGGWNEGREPDEDQCWCMECWGGCYAFLSEDKRKIGDRQCDSCTRGAHYLEDGSVLA